MPVKEENKGRGGIKTGNRIRGIKSRIAVKSDQRRFSKADEVNVE